jgi:hypothetical protein
MTTFLSLALLLSPACDPPAFAPGGCNCGVAAAPVVTYRRAVAVQRTVVLAAPAAPAYDVEPVCPPAAAQLPAYAPCAPAAVPYAAPAYGYSSAYAARSFAVGRSYGYGAAFGVGRSYGVVARQAAFVPAYGAGFAVSRSAVVVRAPRRVVVREPRVVRSVTRTRVRVR